MVLDPALTNFMELVLPIVGVLITAILGWAVTVIRQRTAKLSEQIDNATIAQYLELASEVVIQVVKCLDQTVVAELKEAGAWTENEMTETFDKAKAKIKVILGNGVIATLNQVLGDFNAWLNTKIEEAVFDINTEITGIGVEVTELLKGSEEEVAATDADAPEAEQTAQEAEQNEAVAYQAKDDSDLPF